MPRPMGPRSAPMRRVARPVGALVMEVGAQERGALCRAAGHVGRRGRGGEVPVMVLARARQTGQSGVDRILRGRSRTVREGVAGGRPRKRRAHQDDRSEHVGPGQGAEARDPGAEIVTGDEPGKGVSMTTL